MRYENPAGHGRVGGGRGPDRRRPAAARASAVDRPSRLCAAMSPSAIARPRATPTPTWRGRNTACSARRSPARASPRPIRDRRGGRARCPIQPQSPGLADRIWWGSGTRATAAWAGEQGMNLMSSTLLTEDTGVPFDRAAGRADRDLPLGVGRGRMGARAARLGQPQRDPDRLRPGPGLLRPRARGTAISSATWTGRSPASGAPIPASPT